MKKKPTHDELEHRIEELEAALGDREGSRGPIERPLWAFADDVGHIAYETDAAGCMTRASRQESLRFLRSTPPTPIEVRSTVNCRSDRVLAEGTQINQVLLSPCTNAAHAMGQQGGLLDVTLADALIGD